MAETNLEQTAKTAPQEEQKAKQEEKKKPIGTLESVIKESSDLVKAGFNLGLAGLIPYAQALLAPQAARDTGILAGVQVLGDATTNFKRGKKTTSAEVLKSSAVGTAIAVPTYYLFKYINKIPLDSIAGYFGRAAAFGGIAAPAFTAFYQGVDYFVRNLSFKGMGKYIKENYLPTLKKFWTRILPFSLANIFFVPAYLQIPVAAGLQYLFTLFGAPKKGELKEEEKRDKTPYLVAASNAAYKLGRNLIYSPLKAIYEIAKPAPKPPITQPATQAA